MEEMGEEDKKSIALDRTLALKGPVQCAFYPLMKTQCIKVKQNFKWFNHNLLQQ